MCHATPVSSDGYTASNSRRWRSGAEAPDRQCGSVWSRRPWLSAWRDGKPVLRRNFVEALGSVGVIEDGDQ